jgi:hypothetical protein
MIYYRRYGLDVVKAVQYCKGPQDRITWLPSKEGKGVGFSENILLTHFNKESILTDRTKILIFSDYGFIKIGFPKPIFSRGFNCVVASPTIT